MKETVCQKRVFPSKVGNTVGEEATLLIIKPDGLEKGLVGSILERFERMPTRILDIKLVRATEELLLSHYSKDKAWYEKCGAQALTVVRKHGLDVMKHFGEGDAFKVGQTIYKWLIRYMMRGPSIVVILQGKNCIEMCRELAGSTNPSEAARETIRGDFGCDSIDKSITQKRAIENLVHVSEDLNEAKREIAIWFPNSRMGI